MTNGPITAALEAEVRDKIQKSHLVLWLDAAGHYTSIVDALAARHAAYERAHRLLSADRDQPGRGTLHLAKRFHRLPFGLASCGLRPTPLSGGMGA
jgi:hypothetical protein